MAYIFKSPKAVPADTRPARTTAKAKPSDAYIVRGLTEVDDVFAGLVQHRVKLQADLSTVATERKESEKDLAADTSPEISETVSALLGDGPGAKAGKRKRVLEAKQREADLNAAIVVIEQRIRDAQVPANRAACAAVKPEFAKRVAVMADAMKALDVAHQSFAELCLDLEAEDISYGSLGQFKPFWLGDARDAQRRIATYIKEAAEAGYVS